VPSFTLSFLAILFAPCSAWAVDVVYISVAGDKRVAIYKLDPANGQMSTAGDISTSAEPGALTTDPERRFLFAAFRSSGELAAFRIEPTTGKLTHINTVPAGADPAHISTDKTGKFLLTACYVAGQVTVHAIEKDGSLSKKPRQTVKTKEKAHAIVLNPSEAAALVPHTGPNVIYAFHWVRGNLAKDLSSHKPYFETPKNTGPRHLVFHPTLKVLGGSGNIAQIAYVDNEQGSSVTVYHAALDAINWHLKAAQTISTLPTDFKGTNACAEIRLHPSNRFLYVSNRGHDSLAGFRIDKGTGRLTSLGQTSTEKTPRSFDFDPSGKFLFAAGESSGRLAAYRVIEASGKLERYATYKVGKTPWWVMSVRLP
jgi:6-phosphogluconolactonase